MDLRKKKILRSRSITLLDLLGEEGIEEVLSDPLQRGAPPENRNTRRDELFSRDFAYFAQSRSLFLMGRLKEVEITFKIQDLFTADLLKGVKVMKRRKIEEAKNTLQKFGDYKLLTFYSGEVWSTFFRPLAWLDLDTLEETKVAGSDKKGMSRLLFRAGSSRHGSCSKLTKNRILVQNQHLLSIYDFELGDVIDQQIYQSSRPPGGTFKKIDNLNITNKAGQIHLLRTQKNTTNKVEIVEKQ